MSKVVTILFIIFFMGIGGCAPRYVGAPKYNLQQGKVTVDGMKIYVDGELYAEVKPLGTPSFKFEKRHLFGVYILYHKTGEHIWIWPKDGYREKSGSLNDFSWEPCLDKFNKCIIPKLPRDLSYAVIGYDNMLQDYTNYLNLDTSKDNTTLSLGGGAYQTFTLTPEIKKSRKDTALFFNASRKCFQDVEIQKCAKISYSFNGENKDPVKFWEILPTFYDREGDTIEGIHKGAGWKYSSFRHVISADGRYVNFRTSGALFPAPTRHRFNVEYGILEK